MTDIAFEAAPQAAPSPDKTAAGRSGAPPAGANAPKPPRRGGRLSFFSALLSFSLVLALAAFAAVAYVASLADAPGPLAAGKTVFIPPRSYHADLVAKLESEGVIANSYWFEAVVLFDGARGKLKAGEYDFPKAASLRQVERILVEGKVVLHKLVVPEGMTSQQAIERVNADPFLAGAIQGVPAEGTLQADTYKFTRGFPRARLLAKMAADQRALVAKIWDGRDASIPLKSPLELVTLASIVEKETGKFDERPHVASVFYNRLRLKMRLQTDPTVVYGLVGGKGVLGHRLTKDDLAKPTAYNTYLIPGLPPGPIANPGRAALEAVAHPANTKDLYFVADGTGGHAFAATLKDHLANVAKWRALRNANDNAPAVAPAPTPAAPTAPAVGQPVATPKVGGEISPAQEKAPAPAIFTLAAIPPKPSQFDLAPAFEGDPPALVGDAGAVDRVSVADAGASAPPTGATDGADGQVDLFAESAAAAPTDAAPKSGQSGAAPGAKRALAFDASEGTPLDPLRDTTYDLSYAKAVPKN